MQPKIKLDYYEQGPIALRSRCASLPIPGAGTSVMMAVGNVHIEVSRECYIVRVLWCLDCVFTINAAG